MFECVDFVVVVCLFCFVFVVVVVFLCVFFGGGLMYDP